MFLVFNYLHNNHFIYRDLKPNNVIIDKNKTLVLIDFDRMIEYKNIINESISEWIKSTRHNVTTIHSQIKERILNIWISSWPGDSPWEVAAGGLKV